MRNLLEEHAEPEEHTPSAFAAESYPAAHHLVESIDEPCFLHDLKALAPREALHLHATDRVTLCEAVRFHWACQKLLPVLNNHQRGIHFDHQNVDRPLAHQDHDIRNNVVEGLVECLW